MEIVDKNSGKAVAARLIGREASAKHLHSQDYQRRTDSIDEDISGRARATEDERLVPFIGAGIEDGDDECCHRRCSRRKPRQPEQHRVFRDVRRLPDPIVEAAEVRLGHFVGIRHVRKVVDDRHPDKDRQPTQPNAIAHPLRLASAFGTNPILVCPRNQPDIGLSPEPTRYWFVPGTNPILVCPRNQPDIGLSPEPTRYWFVPGTNPILVCPRNQPDIGLTSVRRGRGRSVCGSMLSISRRQGGPSKNTATVVLVHTRCRRERTRRCS
jgi:hypothetical protein